MLNDRKSKQYFLLVGDICVLVISLTLALVVRNLAVPETTDWVLHLARFLPTFAGWALIMYTAGLYDPERVWGLEPALARLILSSVLATLLTALLFYLRGRGGDITPKTVLALFGVISFFLLWGWRSLAGRVGRNVLPKAGVAFVGWNGAIPELERLLSEKPSLGYEIRLAFDENGGFPEDFESRVSSLGEFVKAVDERSIGFIVIVDQGKLSEAMRLALFKLLGHPVRFLDFPGFYELIARRVPVGFLDDLWFLENIDMRTKRYYESIKRAVDIFVAALAMLVSLAFWPFIALAIKLSSPGTVFFAQNRLGLGGKVFRIYKFRTMRSDRNDFAPTTKGDPRVTGVGRFLRATRLDEIPQLINILSGDMSFVGPRPERPELVEDLEKAIPYYRQRLLVKPGLTGWDQVSGEYHSPSIEDTYKKLQFDLYYIKNISPLLDISIFLKTIMTVLQRDGR
jgi:exopolysaccharide biosynthesis polyprenyl glycosylphosphotransferase